MKFAMQEFFQKINLHYPDKKFKPKSKGQSKKNKEKVVENIDDEDTFLSTNSGPKQQSFV